MKSPEDIRLLLERRYRNQHRNWLRNGNTPGTNWPLTFSLGVPTEKQAQEQFDAFRLWVSCWREWNGTGKIEWYSKRWPSVGSHSVPAKVSLCGPEQVADWVGETARWRRAHSRYLELTNAWPLLAGGLACYFDDLADYPDGDYARLKAVLGWIQANPQSNIYPRQIPLSGLDSKWLEQRKTLMTDLIAILQQDDSNSLGFFQRCGLKEVPRLIRVRLLDASLRDFTGGLNDFACSLTELISIRLPVARVYIVENLQTGLAFEEIDRSVVVMGLGYGVVLLGQVPWISTADCVYWGDVDTHGFAILSRLRSQVPQLRSVLMDEETFVAHKDLWGSEQEQYPVAQLSSLTTAEESMYKRLKEQFWGQNVRLEQERIAWNYAWKAIEAIG